VTDFQPWDIRDALPHSIGGPVDLIVASNCIHAVPNLRTALHNIREALTEQGFFLLHEATSTHYAVLSTWGFIDQLWHYDDPQDRSSGAYLTRSKWEGLLDECGFDIVATQEDRVESAIFLCRKRSDTQKHIQSLCLTSDISVDVPAIQSQLYQTQAQAQPQPQPQEVHNGDEHRFWLQGDAQTSPGLVGMVNCLRREPGSESIRCLYEDEPGQLQEAEKAARYPLDLAVNVYKDGQWGSYRHVPVDIPAVNTQNAYLDIENTGDLSTLRWFEAENWRLERMEFEPYYFGLNFKAVMMATGKLIDAGNAADKLFKRIGGEFAGVAKDGRRVMGYIEESFSTKMVQDTGSLSCIFEVPEQWTLKQAATVPVVYLTAYLALLLRAKLQPGERILIHAGSGGVGQAAINIALSMGCEIFTTVGTDQKRDFIKTTFPTIAPENIGNSRDTSFEELVMVRTQGKGVDVVLNSLSDEKLHASLRVLAPRGRFVEIGRYDMMQDTPIGMSTFVHEASFYGIYLDNVLDANNPESGKLFKLLSDGINAGVVKPLHHMVFNKDQVTEAFRYMSRGKHIGKVLIGLRDEDDKRPLALEAKRKFWCHPEKTYVVTGGLGGVGLELAEWLVQRGAKSLVITSRSGIKNNYQRFRINCWQAKGVQVLVSGKNVANVDEAESLLKEAQAINPVGGVFHLAMVLEDALFINQSVERFQNVYDIKFGGGRNLDRLSRKLCPSLEKFVVFSSISSGLGNGGQTNYGLANSAMERLCERRKKDGYPALAIQWGIIGDVGFVADNKLQVHIGSYPIMAQSIHSCLETLDQFVNQDSPVVFSATYDLDLRANHATSQHASKQDLSVEGLIESVKRILGMSGDHEVSEDRTLSELGMDSLMAVEIEHVFNSDYDLNTSLAKVRNLTIADIKKLYFHRYEQAQGETTGDAMTSTEDDQAFALTEVIMPFHVVPQATQAIYFVNGFMVDSRGVLEDLHFPKTCNAYSVHYELTESMGELADTWKAHIESLAAENITVHIVGFSLGALIAQRFAKLLELAGVDVAVNIIGISPPKLELFKLVEQYTLEQIDAMSVDQGMEYARSMPFYGEFAMLGVKQIMNQARFMMHDHFYSKELAQADLIVLPVDDNLCYSKQEAMKFSQRIIATDGNHIVSTIDFEKIWLEANIG
jgi:fatty acid synthase